MAEIPWWAWIAIIALIVWGVLGAISMMVQRPAASDKHGVDRDELDRLKRRVEDLESQVRRLQS